MTSTFERLSAILPRDHGLQPSSLSFDAQLQSLGIDSLGTVELLWNIEDEFRIKVPYDAEDLPTVGDVVRYVDQLVAQQRLKLVSSSPPASAWPNLQGR